MRLIKRRHVYLKVFVEDGEGVEISPSDLFFGVKNLYERLFGTTACSLSYLRVEEAKADGFIVSINRASLNELMSVLTLLNKVKGVKVSLRVSGVSGTKRGARRRNSSASTI
ncbi:MAG: Rpp14/Pop5 family protein [Candidatus Geothermarchaeales archaeon]